MQSYLKAIELQEEPTAAYSLPKFGTLQKQRNFAALPGLDLGSMTDDLLLAATRDMQRALIERTTSQQKGVEALCIGNMSIQHPVPPPLNLDKLRTDIESMQRIVGMERMLEEEARIKARAFGGYSVFFRPFKIELPDGA